MRVNVYTEELEIQQETGRSVAVVTAKYISSRTGQEMTNYGLRVFLKSPPELHDSPKDDDRSAVTFWCGDNQASLYGFIDMLALALPYEGDDAQSVDTAPAGILGELSARD